MPVRRNRKGKQGGKQGYLSRVSTSSTTTSTTGSSIPEAVQKDSLHVADAVDPSTKTVAEKESTDALTIEKSSNNQAAVNPLGYLSMLVVTSDKRRGVYECDYCGIDISQSPRIRCAVCDDFDVCCDCLATTNPESARLYAAATNATRGTTSVESSSTTTTTSSSKEHNPLTHGYRVCDSTRYPLFPVRSSALSAAKSAPPPATTTTTTINMATTALEDADSTDSRANSTLKHSSVQVNPSVVAPSSQSDSNRHEKRTNDDDPMETNADYGVDKTLAPTAESASTTMPVEGPQTEPGSLSSNVSTADTSRTTDPDAGAGENSCRNAGTELFLHAGDDMKTIWTVEEDLRLLQGIQTHGLGNWTDISESVAGLGSQGKTPKRCMERYLDDYMGRYGHILPPYTFIETEPIHSTTSEVGSTATSREEQDDDTQEPSAKNDADSSTQSVTNAVGNGDADAAKSTATATPGKNNVESVDNHAPKTSSTLSGIASTLETTTTGAVEVTRSSKRRAAMLRSPSNVNGGGTGFAHKKYKAVATESLPEYIKLRPVPFLPVLESGPAQLGQDVCRDQMWRAEQSYARTIASLDSKESVERVRKEWESTRLNKPGGPTVLPMRPDDVPNMPGSELLGYMPRRGDFDVEWENNAEEAIADIEFIPGESEQDRQLKLQVLAIYNSKLDEREKRKTFVLTRKLYNYREYQQMFQQLPQDERDLVQRMRLFERFHTPEEHRIFVLDILKAKRMRKEIARLQMYRRMGIRTLVEAEQFELDKARRLFHKNAIVQKQAETKKAGNASASSKSGLTVVETKLGAALMDNSESSNYWKQYRTTDRKVRKSVNRGAVPMDDVVGAVSSITESIRVKDPESEGDKVYAKPDDDDSMDIHSPTGASTAETGDKGSLTKNDNTDNPEDGICDKESDFAHLPGYTQLSTREVDLCRSVELSPAQYLEIKRALIYESLTQGLLDNADVTNQASKPVRTIGKVGKRLLQHTLVKIDVERKGTVIDFVVQAGWIPSQFGKTIREGM